MLLKSSKYLFWFIGVTLLLRLITVVLLPYGDTTEARYGEMARIMAETGDWITPYFDYGVPFWGKPPLSFWMQALGFKIFGVNEFAARFPAWIFTILTALIVFKLVEHVSNRQTALLSVFIFVTTLLVYALAGAVLTDPYLALATTMSLSAFILVQKDAPKYWGYLFFVGLGLGLLAKGPIAIILIAGPIGLWLLLAKHRWYSLTRLPWLSGIAITAIIALPWYIAAEMKTPGFLEYFILGEHFYRFVDPGWSGDLYGTAHKQPKGTIWILWIYASMPWGIYALSIMLKYLAKKDLRPQVFATLKNDDYSFYLLWAIFTMMFFTMAGNILSTYILPALPALAILLALYFHNTGKAKSWVLNSTAIFSPLLLLIALSYVLVNPEQYRSEKRLVTQYQELSNNQQPLYFVNDRSFSARYYSKGQAKLVNIEEMLVLIQKEPNSKYYIALPRSQASNIEKSLGVELHPLSESRLYRLYVTQ